MATLTIDQSASRGDGARKDLDISVALGGGGAKGNSHIGVLRFLEKQGFRIRAIAGSSFGGLVACFYAAGFSPDQIEEIFAQVDQSKMYARVRQEKSSLLGLTNVDGWLSDRFGEFTFDDMLIPCAVTAVDLRTANEVVIRSGSVRQAILSTIALPGIFPSLLSEELELIDGALLNPVPVAVARSLAPSLPVVAVALNSPLGEPPHRRSLPWLAGVPSRLAARLINMRFAKALDVFMRSIEIGGRQIAELRLELEKPEVVIRPAVAHIGVLDRVDVQELVKLGEEAAEAKLPDLLRATTWSAGLGRLVFQRPTWSSRPRGLGDGRK
jgi:NTE family protein